MENNNSFTLKDVIFNLLFIILFVFILLWLFPSKSFLNDKFDSINNCGNTTHDKGSQTNQLFNQNITTMKEAAISYFTTPRLPKKVGEKVKMTLKEMRDKKLLLSLIDTNGNVCSEDESFVEIVKEKDEYILKVSLKCSDFEDYILVYLGCYDYCDGDICEKEAPKEISYQYEYKLVKPCQMTGWSNWTNWSSNYIAANSNRKVETKIETETVTANIQKTCPEGYLYNVYNNKCYKSIDSTEIRNAEIKSSYNCPNGYILDSKDNLCKKQITKTTTVAAKVNTSYICSEGYVFDSKDKLCKKQITTTSSVLAKTKPTTYNCDKYSGYTLNGNKCTKNISNTSTSTVEVTKTPVYDYKCSNGTLSEDKKTCSYTSYFDDSMSATKSCSTKTVRDCSSGSCKYVPKTSCTYSCPSGTTKNGSMCYFLSKTTETTLSTKYIKSYDYSCPEGYNLEGDSCTKKVTTNTVDTKEATKNPTIYYCEDNKYKLVGNVCEFEKTETLTEKPVIKNTYYCEDNEHKLEKDVCKLVKTETSVEKPTKEDTYSCDKFGKEYTLNKNKCEKMIINTDEKDVILTCSSGYNIKDNNTCVSNKSITLYRYSERSCVGGSVDYKWSNSDKDQSLLNQGYVLTGNKKEIKSK